jgi:hypothetical protein
MADWEAAYWGAGVDRLRAIKSRYDPTNVFSFEQSIAPAPPRFAAGASTSTTTDST